MRSIAQQIIDNTIVSNKQQGVVQSASPVAWSDISSKPSTYPSAPHNNTAHSEHYSTQQETAIASKRSNTLAVAMSIALG